MKVVILAGGYGTRIGEETEVRPKPMVEVGGKPLLWHIMKTYSHYGHNDFIICLGYKGYLIKEYFANYFMHQSDVTFDFTANNQMKIHNNSAEPWRVTLVDTGLKTQTGGRINRVKKYLGDESFMMTYGDGLGDVNIPALIEQHKKHGKIATLTAVHPVGRFGTLSFGRGDEVKELQEKTEGDNTWINGGYFVLEPKIFDLLKGDDTVFELEPMESLTGTDQLAAYRHNGFWQPMDTMREKILLERLWQEGSPPWRVWG